MILKCSGSWEQQPIRGLATQTKAPSLFVLSGIVASLDLQSTHTPQWPKHKPKPFKRSKQTFPTDSSQGMSYRDASCLPCLAPDGLTSPTKIPVPSGGSSLGIFLENYISESKLSFAALSSKFWDKSVRAEKLFNRWVKFSHLVFLDSNLVTVLFSREVSFDILRKIRPQLSLIMNFWKLCHLYVKLKFEKQGSTHYQNWAFKKKKK